MNQNQEQQAAQAEAAQAQGAQEEAAATDAAAPQTFTEALQVAISRFSLSVGSLDTASIGVTITEDEVTEAQNALALAQSVRTAKVTAKDAARAAAVDSRDDLVAVLQAWTP